MKHVFIIGSRGLPAKYGGFETFVNELVSHQVSDDLRYHVACLSDDSHHQHSNYKQVDCFTINPPKLGPARVIAYDMMAISYALKLIKKEGIEKPIFYILGNTIGAFIFPFARRIHKIGGQLFINPDGLEWKRSKWSKPVQTYLKYSEKVMTQYADLVISDNEGIETYIQEAYPWSKTTFIAYGTDLSPTEFTKESEQVRTFFDKWAIEEKGYYLIIGRFVPENNYARAICEFMDSETKRDLVIVCNYEGSSYFEQLRQETHFDNDSRIKFVGTVYDKDLLKYLRQECRAYIHGHEVGGTNPSLLEALASTKLNLLLDVGFNREVGEDGAIYWKKDELARVIEEVEGFDQAAITDLDFKSSQRILSAFTWEKIVSDYEEVFKG